MKKYILGLSLLVVCFSCLFITACDDNDTDMHNKELIIKIASERLFFNGDGIGYLPYYGKTYYSDQWKSFDGISGFEYEEGYEYVLRIWQEKWHNGEIADAGIYRYKLLEVISKEKKDSEDIPSQTFFLTIGSARMPNPTPEAHYQARIGDEWKPFPEMNNFYYQEGYEYVLLIERTYNGPSSDPKFNFTCKKIQESTIDIANVNKEIIITVASDKLLSYTPTYFVKENGSKDWICYPAIEGFYHEHGYEYILRVKRELGNTEDSINPFTYTLIEIISKEKKYSTGPYPVIICLE